MKTKFYLPLFITAILFLYPSFTEIKAQDSLYLIGTITGESSEKKIVGVKGVGDVNGDGYGDFMISMRTGKTRSDQGIAKLYLGSANINLIPDITFHYPGKDSLNNFGNASGIGDVNGDGYDDFTISGSFGDWGFPKSKVFLYFGGETIDTMPVNEFYQPNAIQDNFGNSVVSVGDINKDNYNDFAIGSSYNWTNSKGYVYLFWGGDTISWERSVTFSSDTLEDFFGESVANIGDVNKDGFDDIAIGATAWVSGHETGKVYVYYGSIQMDTEVDAVLTADNFEYGFGDKIKNAGDINKDGVIDFMVGSKAANIFLYLGIDSLTIINAGLFGYGGYINFETGCDINNDGYNDFIVGNTNYLNDDSLWVGGAFCYLGNEQLNNIYHFKYEGETRGSEFSKTMSTEDINNDGYDEVFILAPSFPDFDNPFGKVYIYSYNKVDDVKNSPDKHPIDFQLYQNYPNPFNPSTVISWESPVFSHITIKIFDILGKEVATLLNEERPAGRYKIEFDASKYQLSNGIYIYTLETNGRSISRKTTYLK